MSKYNKIKGDTIQSGTSADVDSERFYYDTTANEYRLKLASPVASWNESYPGNSNGQYKGMYGDVDGAYSSFYFTLRSTVYTPSFTRAPIARTQTRYYEWNGSTWSGANPSWGFGGLGTFCYTGNPSDARSVGGSNYQGWGSSDYAPYTVTSATNRNDHIEFDGTSWTQSPANFTASGEIQNNQITRAPDTSDTVIGHGGNFHDWNGSSWTTSNIPSDPISANIMSGGGADDMITVTQSNPGSATAYMVEPLSTASANIYNGTSWSSTPAMNHGMAGAGPTGHYMSNMMGDSAAAIAISNTMTSSTYPGDDSFPGMRGIDYDNNTTETWNGTTWTSNGKNPAFVPLSAGGAGVVPATGFAYQSGNLRGLTYNGGGTGSLNGLFWDGGPNSYGHGGAAFSAANGYKYNFET